MTFGLVLLTFNEIDGLKELWDKIPYDNFDEFFAVDGGSTDGTLDFFKIKLIYNSLMQLRCNSSDFFYIIATWLQIFFK